MKVLIRDYEKFCNMMDSCVDSATRVKDSLDSFG